LEYHKRPLSFDYMHTAKERYFEIGHFCNFRTSVTLTVDPGQGHTVLALSDLYLHSEFRRNWKNFPWMDIGTDFTRSTWRSLPKIVIIGCLARQTVTTWTDCCSYHLSVHNLYSAARRQLRQKSLGNVSRV